MLIFWGNRKLIAKSHEILVVYSQVIIKLIWHFQTTFDLLFKDSFWSGHMRKLTFSRKLNEQIFVAFEEDGASPHQSLVFICGIKSKETFTIQINSLFLKLPFCNAKIYFFRFIICLTGTPFTTIMKKLFTFDEEITYFWMLQTISSWRDIYFPWIEYL